MPDWLLAVPRLVAAPFLWGWRWVKKRTTDRRDLVKEGSAAVTPVIQIVRGSLGPTAILFGTREQNSEQLKATHGEWQGRRGTLMAYGNQHPSDDVRALVHDYEFAVNQAYGDTVWLLSNQNTAQAHSAYEASKASHDAAIAKGERLMKAIRRY